ncbi:hypothetical protein CLAFUW4_02370 [Fulvia fulva]|uniref:Uncharacterized protein n=1 Tax=Passalora fulva TaxID=5499 RepID=A0A9Q8L957_PASFU|nr:uncharacterized protein CLAFUR5_02358 [Fulvia fulva]KAK4631129.1 hypothetical protein CLAFUR4_02365 [Fulvia fulva]KAK4632797.1 hypothetical protein CLAFUR0_02369 [Fulvia fulva]UJO13092.1 hypothetical protein CLAFUR5_02358 [Fulvia fulva]WPV11101.1 hypothetical protein CLAFUW4_02370 [Fulvia fulva]WPV26744.1 hypothetical protein CLAFUW7_02370 [Fulvia fulva]
MADSKAKEAAEERRESTGTALPVYDTRSVTSADELYYVTPQATGQNEKEAAEPSKVPKTLEELKAEWEQYEGPMTHESFVDTEIEMRNRMVETALRSQAARQEAPPLPPKTLIDDERVMVEKNVTFQDEQQPPVLHRRPTTEDDEKLAMQLQAEEDSAAAARQQEVEEVPPSPSLPTRHTSFAPSFGTESQPFTLSWRRPLTDYPSLTITPNSSSSDASSYWRLNYQTKYFARLHRYSATDARVDGDFPARQVAELKFPEFIWPGCGPTLKLEPYDEAVGPRRADIFMRCTGWMTTRYAVDVPVLGGARCTWRTLRPVKRDVPTPPIGEDAAHSQDGPSWQPDPDVDGRLTLSSTSSEPRQLLTVGDLVSQAKNLINDETWTPYPPHHLIMGTSPNSGRIIATYTRAAPWNKNAGTLSINTDHSTSPEYIEGIIIACAAMVGMQDRMGLASSLMEASTESIMASKRKGNGGIPLTPGRIRPYIRSLHKSQTAPVNSEVAEEDPYTGVASKPSRSGSVQRSLKRLSMQAQALVPKSAGAAPARKSESGKVDEKMEVGVAA